MRTQSATTTVTHAVTVAQGVFAPGHLGELTQYLPFELVDDVLAETRTVQRRLRDLPSRAGVYFVLALGMFPQPGISAGVGQADRRAGRPGPAAPVGKSAAGPAPPSRPGAAEGAVRGGGRAAGPAAHARRAVRGAAHRRLRWLNSLKIPDTGRNRAWIGKIRHRLGLAGYPALRVMALAETGTRGLLGATVGSATDRDEASLARRLLHLLRPGMLVLLDRAFDSNAFLAEVHATGAMLLCRAKSSRTPRCWPPARRLLPVPPGQAWMCASSRPSVAMTGADGTRIADRYRLITTLIDHRATPLWLWSGSTTSGGRSSPRSWPCGTPCWAAGCCARVTGPASSRNCGPC